MFNLNQVTSRKHKILQTIIYISRIISKSFQILEIGDLVAEWRRHGVLRPSLRQDGVHRATEPGLFVQVYTDI